MSEIESYLLGHLDLGISAHNSQPFIFSFSESKKILISVNSTRKLPYADPHEKDLQTSLGATVHLLECLLKAQGYLISACEIQLTPDVTAEIQYQPGAIPNGQDLQLLERRFSFRGTFDKIDLPVPSIQSQFLRFSNDKNIILKIAQLYDEVNYQFILKPGYLAELYSWLRFSKKNLRWSADGLNAEAMSLGLIEALGGALVMRPRVFSFLAKLGIGRALIAESPKIRSAPFLVAIFSEKPLSYFEQGRLFLKAWLQLTEINLFGAPLSLLTDHPEGTKTVLELMGLPPTATLINVLRVGPLPKNFKPYPRARLSAAEINHV